jgi:hypothetical protein
MSGSDLALVVLGLALWLAQVLWPYVLGIILMMVVIWFLKSVLTEEIERTTYLILLEVQALRGEIAKLREALGIDAEWSEPER